MLSSVQNCRVGGFTEEDVGNNLPSAVFTTSLQAQQHTTSVYNADF